MWRGRQKKGGTFRCSNYLVVILSKLLSERTDASLSFFLTLSGMIQRAGVDHLILRRLEENVLFIPCLRFLPRSAAHFSVDVMPLRLCDGGCCLAFYQRLRSCLDLYSKQYWSDWVNCSLLYLCGLLLLRAGFTASDICCRCWCRNEIGKNKLHNSSYPCAGVCVFFCLMSLTSARGEPRLGD